MGDRRIQKCPWHSFPLLVLVTTQVVYIVFQDFLFNFSQVLVMGITVTGFQLYLPHKAIYRMYTIHIIFIFGNEIICFEMVKHYAITGVGCSRSWSFFSFPCIPLLRVHGTLFFPLQRILQYYGDYSLTTSINSAESNMQNKYSYLSSVCFESEWEREAFNKRQM